MRPPVSEGFAVIDLETTGLAPDRGARALEIGMVFLDPNGDITGEWQTLVNPECGAGPTHIHGVTDDMVETAPTFAEIAGDLAMRLEHRTVVAHNAAFDVSFLDAEFRRIGCSWKRAPLCTMKLARRRGFHPVNLAYLCTCLSITNHGAHHALGDAHATAELLVHLEVQPGELPGTVRFPDGHPEPSGRFRLRPEPEAGQS